MKRGELDVRVISIGTLAAHPLWDERGSVRTGHATTTLVRSGDAVIVVDPGLPAQMIAARLNERAGIDVGAVTHVFLTSFQPDTTRGLGAFEHAKWLVSGAEREAVGGPIAAQLMRIADEDGDAEVIELLRREVSLLKKCKAAPDSIAPGVDLFPMHGVTAGMTGLLVSEPTSTTLIAGDAVATMEHVKAGKVLQTSVDVEGAKESFQEAVEIADWLIPGRDNLMANPLRRAF